MHKRYKDYEGKALAWSATGPGKRRIIRLFYKRLMMSLPITRSFATIQNISSIKAVTKEQKTKKVAAIASEVIRANAQVIKIYRES